SKCVANKIEPQKVTNLVGTFWTDGSKSAVITLYLARVATKSEPEKMTNTVETFCHTALKER
ncbi:hypothetical protein, partial [Emticicia sp. C21]|uniref:hypothetical protein n=1 Tax=Emticicia sp. C21 TaxID=2302915 RepID=UPI001E533B0B